MSRIYRPRHPERTVLYSVLFHYFEPFLLEYENRFERHFGHLRPIIQEVVDKYLDCGNPKCGFARIRCPDCGAEKLLMFSCKTRGFCPSCHAKRRNKDLVQKILHWRHTGFNVHSIDPLICPKCGGTMRIVSFIEDHKAIDKIIKHLNLTFKAARPRLLKLSSL